MKKKPNIVFILIDDLGWKDLSCYGSKFYETPNIDKLQKEGIYFTNAYAACPLCSPTRASILTGKYPAKVGVTNVIGANAKGVLIDAPHLDYLPLSEKTLASALKEGGHNTWHVGKWHLGSKKYYPQNHGFDKNIGGCHWGMPLNGYFSPWGIETLEDGPKGEYLTDRLTDEAIKLIKESDSSKPFFLNLCYYSVHVPIQAKESYIEKYRKKAKEMGLDKIKTFEVGEKMPAEYVVPLLTRQVRIFRRLIQSDPVYAAMIEILDENIGRLVQTIDETGQADNTIIVFTSDNGGLSTSQDCPTTNHPLSEGKGWMYEGGIREPLIIKWPETITPGSVCNVPVTSPDFYPTLLEACDLPPNPEQHSDGVSLIPLIEGGDKLDREAIFWHFPHYGGMGGTPFSSVRMGNYKLIEFFEDDRLELYNLKEDISEKSNLIKEYPKIAEKMHKRLVDWRNNVKAKIPKPNPNWIGLE
jgi:arylsulfatase A-like enzyme